MKGKTIQFILFYSIIVIILIPFVITIPFATLSADDFAATVKHYSFQDCYLSARNYYYSWGGQFPVFVLGFLLNPLQFAASYSLLNGFELLIFFFMFVLAIFLLMKIVFKNIFFMESEWTMRIIYTLFLIALLNSGIYSEVFYWYSGAFYSVDKIFIILLIICSIWLFKTERYVLACITTSVCGFLACFSYTMAVTTGLVYLLFWYISIKRKYRNKSYKYIVPLLFMIVGGCLAAFAPGNFSRHSVTIGTGIQLGNIWNAMINAFKNSLKGVRLLLFKPFVIISFITAFWFGVFAMKGKYNLKPIILWIISFISVFFLLFPIALGYEGRGLPNRHIFELNLLIICWGVFLLFYTGGYYSAWILKKRRYIEIVSILFIGLSVIIQPTDSFDGSPYSNVKYPWLRTISQINNVVEESKFNRGILQEIETSQTKKVNVFRNIKDLPAESGIICDIRVASDPHDWINLSMSDWFDKDTISYQIKQY